MLFGDLCALRTINTPMAMIDGDFWLLFQPQSGGLCTSIGTGGCPCSDDFDCPNRMCCNRHGMQTAYMLHVLQAFKVLFAWPDRITCLSCFNHCTVLLRSVPLATVQMFVMFQSLYCSVAVSSTCHSPNACHVSIIVLFCYNQFQLPQSKCLSCFDHCTVLLQSVLLATVHAHAHALLSGVTVGFRIEPCHSLFSWCESWLTFRLFCLPGPAFAPPCHRGISTTMTDCPQSRTD
jgi:hypothetical protein